jgi:hypothetical protein
MMDVKSWTNVDLLFRFARRRFFLNSALYCWQSKGKPLCKAMAFIIWVLISIKFQDYLSSKLSFGICMVIIYGVHVVCKIKCSSFGKMLHFSHGFFLVCLFVGLSVSLNNAFSLVPHRKTKYELFLRLLLRRQDYKSPTIL